MFARMRGTGNEMTATQFRIVLYAILRRGGVPDDTGETVLDSLLCDGNTLNVGAVAAIRRCVATESSYSLWHRC